MLNDKDIAVYKQERFEEGVVMGLLVRYALLHRKWTLMAHSDYAHAQKYLSLDMFERSLAQFPIRLSVAWPFVQTDWCRPAKLFAQLSRLPVTQQYLELRRSIAPNKPFGLLFRFANTKEMILHDLRLPDRRDGVQIQTRFRGGGTIVVEQFRNFLRAMDNAHKPHTWMPAAE